MFGWEYPPYAAGGLATATIALANGLTREGADLTLVVPFPADPDAVDAPVVSAGSTPRRTTYEIHRIPSPLQGYATGTTVFAAAGRSRTETPTPYRSSLLHDVAEYAEHAAEIARATPHDVIDAHDWMSFPAAAAAQAVSGKPIVAHIHATEFDRSGDWHDPAIRTHEQAGLLNAQRVIANSNVTKKQIVERYGVPAELVDVIHWGIDRPLRPHREPSLFGRQSPIVLFVGRLVRQKGPDYFVEAAAQVAALHPAACFVVAGAGDMLPPLIERAIDLGIASRVFFTGGLPREDLLRLYRMATVCVMPSVSEPFGLVALESLREGTPVIISRTAGAAESIANVIRVDFWDVADIADKILAVLNDQALQTELQERAAEELSDLARSTERTARLTLEAYRRAIRSGHLLEAAV